MPATGVSDPVCWVRPARFLIDLGTLLTNGDGRSAVSLNRCQKFHTAVTVPVIVQVDECGQPLTELLFVGKGLAGVIGPVLHCPG